MNMLKNKLKNCLILVVLIAFISIIQLTAEEPGLKTTGSKKDADKLKNWDLGAPPSESLQLLRKIQQDQGNEQYLRKGLHTGNLVETSYLNRGQLADGYHGSNFEMMWPRGSGVSYGFLFDFFVAGEVLSVDGDTIHIISDCFKRDGLEEAPDGSHWWFWEPLPGYYNDRHLNSTEYFMGGISEDVGVDGYPNTNDYGEGNGILDQGEDMNSNRVLDESLINVLEYPAMSHAPETWPEYWPAQSYSGDDRFLNEPRPGKRAGRWNGEFGAYVRGDQESYYVMDDRENDEFEYYPFADSVSALPWPHGRRGLGLTVEVRNYQWTHPLAEDILISRYNIINYGKEISRAVVGMYSDVDVGNTLGNDDADYDIIDDITYVWETTGIADNGLPTGYYGFAFLESPGLSENRKDDDDDGLVDESQGNSIDEDGDWTIWEDTNGNGVFDNEDTNYNGELEASEDINGNAKWDIEAINDDVGSDGLGPEDEGYPGPDENGTEANGRHDQGEPNFGKTDNDEIDQVGLTTWYLKDVDSRLGNDEEFWRVELTPGTFAIDDNYARDVAFTYGCGYIPFERGLDKFQRYAIACLFGVDEQDIFRNKRTMQKIYDSDYSFTKAPSKPILRAITGDKKVTLLWDTRAERSRDPIYGRDFEAYKVYKSTEPYWQEIKTITDAYGTPLLLQPLAIFDLKNGLYGPHPVEFGIEGLSYGVHQDMGTDSGLRHSYIDTLVDNGRTYFYAVVSMDKGYDLDFVERGLSERENLTPTFPSECSAVIQTDALGRPSHVDRNCAVVTPVESAAGYLMPQLENGIEHVSGDGTGSISLNILLPDSIKTGHTYNIIFEDDASLEKWDKTLPTGLTSAMTLVDTTTGDTLLHSEIVEGSEVEDKVMHGFQIKIENDDSVLVKTQGWVSGNSDLIARVEGYIQEAKAIPRDFEIRIAELGAGESYSMVPGRTKVTNFGVFDVTDSENGFPVVYGLNDYDPTEDTPDSLSGILSLNDEIVIRANPLAVVIGGDSSVFYTASSWRIFFELPRGVEDTEADVPEKGSVYRFTTYKPFDRDDKYEFTIIGGTFTESQAKNDLDDIYVVPDPYIAASTLEPRLIRQTGRGQRRVDFVNLPPECTIKIFTMSGHLVQEIEHDSIIEKGREPWDMRTKDGLEVAFGVYIYHVDAPGVGEKIGRFAIIK
jgi:hypothetical protein